MVRELQSRIYEGKLSQGVKLPSERHLAHEFGVSRTSVKAALKELESLGVVSRQANCRPVVAVQNRPQSTRTAQVPNQIAIWMLPETQDLGGAMILQGIRSVLSEKDFCLLITSPPSYETDSVRKAEIQFLHSARENPQVAGVITWDSGNSSCHPVYQTLVESNTPLVFVDRLPEAPISADVVAVNHRRSARRAVRFLLDLGHRSIAMVLGNDRATSVIERVEGYEMALRDKGLHPDPSLLFHLDTSDSVVEAKTDKLVEKLISEQNAPTAVFAVNDRIAFHIAESAKRKGVSIPGQFSLLGFDWLARWMPSGGELTTVAQPFEEIGKAAAQRVLDKIHEPNATPREILFDAELILRPSTAKPLR